MNKSYLLPSVATLVRTVPCGRARVVNVIFCISRAYRILNLQMACVELCISVWITPFRLVTISNVLRL
jgi:hypothetical protein